MKKLSTLIVAFLLTAGMAYAQNTASISQVGNNAEASIDQTGSNDAIISQVTTGLDVSSSIVQVGFDNTATTNLTAGGSKHRGAITEQDQQGNDNFASIVATSGSQDMSAKQTQIGNDNQAIVVAKSDGIVTQTQNGHDNYAEANVVGKASYATQLQTGNNNTATMQAGNASVGRTFQEQVGNDNTSTITGFRSRGSARSYVDTYQEGDINTATVNFSAPGNDAEVDQIGDMNTAFIEFGSKFNTATVMQTGNNNNATVSQN